MLTRHEGSSHFLVFCAWPVFPDAVLPVLQWVGLCSNALRHWWFDHLGDELQKGKHRLLVSFVVCICCGTLYLWSIILLTISTLLVVPASLAVLLASGCSLAECRTGYMATYLIIAQRPDYQSSLLEWHNLSHADSSRLGRLACSGLVLVWGGLQWTLNH